MKTLDDITQPGLIDGWIAEAYDNAKEHGFHDKHQSGSLLLMLIITEISEAVEADRCNKHANFELFNSVSYEQSDDDYRYRFEKYIKNTFEDEIADVIIRLLDYMGWIGISFNVSCPSVKINADIDFYEIAFDWTQWIGYSSLIGSFDPSMLLTEIFDYCKQAQIPIHKYVGLKMKYNRLRPRMHGGKRY